MVAQFFEKCRRGCRGGRRVFEQTGDDREDGGVIREREAAFAGDAREQGVQFVERGGREVAMGGAHAAGVGEFVIEDKTHGAAGTGDGKAVGHVRRNHEKIAGAGATATAVDGLDALARQIEH